MPRHELAALKIDFKIIDNQLRIIDVGGGFTSGTGASDCSFFELHAKLAQTIGSCGFFPHFTSVFPLPQDKGVIERTIGCYQVESGFKPSYISQPELPKRTFKATDCLIVIGGAFSDDEFGPLNLVTSYSVELSRQYPNLMVVSGQPAISLIAKSKLAFYAAAYPKVDEQDACFWWCHYERERDDIADIIKSLPESEEYIVKPSHCDSGEGVQYLTKKEMIEDYFRAAVDKYGDHFIIEPYYRSQLRDEIVTYRAFLVVDYDLDEKNVSFRVVDVSCLMAEDSDHPVTNVKHNKTVLSDPSVTCDLIEKMLSVRYTDVFKKILRAQTLDELCFGEKVDNHVQNELVVDPRHGISFDSTGDGFKEHARFFVERTLPYSFPPLIKLSDRKTPEIRQLCFQTLRGIKGMLKYLEQDSDVRFKHEIRFYREIGSLYMATGQNDVAQRMYEEALSRLETNGHVYPLQGRNYLLFECYNRLGAISGSQGDFKSAIKYTKQAYDYAEHNDKECIAQQLRMLIEEATKETATNSSSVGSLRIGRFS